MIAAVVKENIVTNLIIIDEEHRADLANAMQAELLDARPYGLHLGDLRTEQGWTRNAGGEQILLPLLPQESYDSYSLALQRAQSAEQAALDALASYERMQHQNTETEIEKDAYQHAYEAFFDGLKYISDPENPLVFVSPMYVQPNLYYTKDGKRYVCVKRGICAQEDWARYMEAF